MQEEIWKDVPGYEGSYQVSDLGRVRSLDRVTRYGVGDVTRFIKGCLLKPGLMNGYLNCSFSVENTKQNYKVHQLVAMAFLNYKPNGRFIVVDHINNIKTDNRLENLQVITQRYNVVKDLKIGTSKHTGVYWHTKAKKWTACIRINGKKTYLGVFIDEDEAGLAYQNALKELGKFTLTIQTNNNVEQRENNRVEAE